VTTSSIISIDVDDAKFKRFQELFDRYHKALGKTPEMWAKTRKETGAMSELAERLAITMAAVHQTTKGVSDAAAYQNQQLTVTDRLWTSIARASQSTFHSIFRGAEGLVKWTGILGGIGALAGIGGGLFGIDRMAAGTSRDRRLAMGWGMSIGGARSFDINFQRLLDPAAFLGGINEMETDITKQSPAYALLGRGMTGNTSKDAIAVMTAMRNLAVSTPMNLLGTAFAARGMGDIDAETLRRFKTMNAGEFQGLIGGFNKDSKRLDIPDNMAKRWTDFTTQMERATLQLRKTFEVALSPLAPQLAALSQHFVNAIGAFARSETVKHWIDELAHWLDHLNADVLGTKFENAITSFMDGLGSMAGVMHTLFHPIDSASDLAKNAATWAQDHTDMSRNPTGMFAASGLANLSKDFGLPPGLLAAIASAEPGGASTISRTGGMGIFAMPATAWQTYGARFGLSDWQDPHQAGAAEARFLAHLAGKYSGNTSKILAAAHMGEDRLDSILTKAAKDKRDWGTLLSAGDAAYVSEASALYRGGHSAGAAGVIVINNSDAKVSTAGLNALNPSH
jgi:hypothetical protein